jgi:lipoprotein signal peptidase
MSLSANSKASSWQLFFACIPIFIMFFYGVIHYVQGKAYLAALAYAVIIPGSIGLVIFFVILRKKTVNHIEKKDISNEKRREKDKIVKAFNRGSESSQEGDSQ